MKPLVTAESEPRTRKQFMKWIKLGEGKDPEFDQIYFLYGEVPGIDHGVLISIVQKPSAKEYTFCGADGESSKYTHYCLPTEPQ